MSAAALVQRAVAAGIALRVENARLIVSAVRQPDNCLLEELRFAKPMIVEYLRGLALLTEEDWDALFDERAGIMEFDGVLARLEAETRAAEDVNILRSLVRSGNA